MSFRPPPLIFRVPLEASGSRLDRFLATALASTDTPVSRAVLQRWIELGRVTVDGRVTRASEKLKPRALLAVMPDPPARSEALPDAGVEFDVLFADDEIVVVLKPAGLVMHPARGHAGGTLVNGLLARGWFDAARGGLADERDKEGHVRPGIVHRLDKGTSGVLVVARTAWARERLKAQFEARTIERQYEAVCLGDAPSKTYDTWYGRHPTDRLRFTSRLARGKRAVTHVEARERFGVATHVRCCLETGRTHQIRVHLAESGHAILGDPLYGRTPRDVRLRALADALGHQALHARVLGFVHPRTEHPMRFEVPPPRDFEHVLEALRHP